MPRRARIRPSVALQFLGAAVLLSSFGCGSEIPGVATSEEAKPAIAGTAFNPARTGQVTGRVTWNGAVPSPTGFVYGVPREDGLSFEFRKAPNPHTPKVHNASREVADAVVFLRGIDPAAGRPWDLPEPRVEIGDGQITILQGSRRSGAGFVHRGSSFSAVSTDSSFHVLRARGDAFFGLTLPEANRPVTRTLPKLGLVELSSGTGLYWARGNLFVADHPYFTTTDSEGRFSLDQIPAGKAELVVWLPNWETARQERDPDSTTVTRQEYGPPIEKAKSIDIKIGASLEVGVVLP